jgi:hypothetical protein
MPASLAISSMIPRENPRFAKTARAASTISPRRNSDTIFFFVCIALRLSPPPRYRHPDENDS